MKKNVVEDQGQGDNGVPLFKSLLENQNHHLTFPHISLYILTFVSTYNF